MHCYIVAVSRNTHLSLVRSAIEYGATVWDPYLQQDIDRLDRVQPRGARFITGDYKSRSPGCVTQMLVEHNLLPLQERRKHLRLAFLFKVVEGSLATIPPEDYLIRQRPKRAVCVRTFQDHVTSNILDSQVTNNSRCFGYLHQRANHTDTYSL